MCAPPAGVYWELPADLQKRAEGPWDPLFSHAGARLTAPSEPRRRTAVVTGASSGIGREIALRFARDGWDVVLVARNADALARVHDACAGLGVRAWPVPADLARPDAASKLFERLSSEHVEAAALVNSAGCGHFGPFAAGDLDRVDAMIRVNIRALTELTSMVLPGMLSRRQGRILNVASTAAFHPGPLMAVYSATKAYVLSFSQALATELAGTGVTVTVFCPGPTATGFQSIAGVPAGGARLASAAAAADCGYTALLRERVLATHGVRNRAVHAVLGLLPLTMQSRLVHRARSRASHNGRAPKGEAGVGRGN